MDLGFMDTCQGAARCWQGVLVPPELVEDSPSALLRGHPCLCSLCPSLTWLWWYSPQGWGLLWEIHGAFSTFPFAPSTVCQAVLPRNISELLKALLAETPGSNFSL